MSDAGYTRYQERTATMLGELAETTSSAGAAIFAACARRPRATRSASGAEAKRTHRSKGAVIEALAEEALPARLFPRIAFRGEDWDRRPWVIGTALDVWQVVEAHRDIGSVETMVVEGNLSERQIRLALAYHERFPEEIEEAIAQNRRPLAELRASYPFIDARA